MRVIMKMFSGLKLDLLSSNVGACIWYSNAVVRDGHRRHTVEACLL
jgi:hypothetical protein